MPLDPPVPRNFYLDRFPQLYQANIQNLRWGNQY